MSDPNVSQTEPIRSAERRPYRNPWLWPIIALTGLVVAVAGAVILVGF